MISDKSLTRGVLFFVAVSVLLLPLHGAGLDYLAQEASAVVVGSVANRMEGPREVSFTIDVERVLSGSVPGPALSVVHPWRGLLRSPSRIDQPIRGMWFLKKEASGESWNVLTASPLGVRTIRGLYLPALLTAPGDPYNYPADTPILDALVYEVTAGVQSSGEEPGILMGAFDGINTPVVLEMLRTCLAAGEPGLQAVGIAGSLQRQAPGAIDHLVRLWPVVSADPQSRYVVSALRDAWRDPAPDAVRQLVSMAATEPVGSELLTAAIWALAAIHTKEALPFLASLLYGASLDEQERSIYGLSAFANGCPPQTRGNIVSMEYLQCDQPSAYKTAETEANFAFRMGTLDQQPSLVSFWQNWWVSHPELHR